MGRYTTGQQIELTKSRGIFIFPSGLEKLFLGLYFIIVPFLSGLAFIFFYISDSKTGILAEISKADGSFFLTWIVGYELDAGLFLLYFFYSLIASFSSSSKGKKKNGPRKGHNNRMSGTTKRH